MTSIQIIASAFSLFMIYLTFLHYKRDEFNKYQFIVWEILLVGFTLVIWAPNRLNFLTERLGISRAFDLFAVIAFIVILFLTYHNYSLLTKLEKRINKKISDNALDQLQKYK